MGAHPGGLACPVPSPLRSHRAGERILVVEDAPAVRQLTAALLQAAGYAVETAEDGEQALSLLARDPERYDLLFTDMVLPDLTGLELVARARASRPGQRVVLTSGYTAESIDRLELARSRDPFVEKPFRNAMLLEKVREALDRPLAPEGRAAPLGHDAHDDLDAPIG